MTDADWTIIIPNRIAILCPGRSLPFVWNNSMRTEYEHIVGVNEAAHAYVVDFACFGDIEGRPIDESTPVIAPRKQAYGENPRLWDNLTLPRKPAQVNYASVAALSFALLHKPETVDMYGADMGGTTRMNGRPEIEPAVRWARELEDIMWLQNSKLGLHTTIRRITSFRSM